MENLNFNFEGILLSALKSKNSILLNNLIENNIKIDFNSLEYCIQKNQYDIFKILIKKLTNINIKNSKI